MKQEELSSGSAIFGQVIVILFAVIFTSFCFYIIVNDFTIKGLFIICFMISIVGFFVKNALSYGDVYLIAEKILIKKVTGTTSKLKSEISSVDEGIMPFTFYLSFSDGKKVYFQYKPQNVARNFFFGESNLAITELKDKLKLDKKNNQ